MDLLNKDLSLYPRQVAIIEEMRKRESGFILSVAVGNGKSVMALVRLIERARELGRPALMVLAKSIVGNILGEVDKWFGPSVSKRTLVLHKDYLPPHQAIEETIIPDSTLIVFTTPQVLSYFSKKAGVSSILSSRADKEGISYSLPERPLSADPANLIYRKTWSAMAIDEFHNYVGVGSEQWFAMIGVYVAGSHVICMSGTSMPEVSAKHYLGTLLQARLKDAQGTKKQCSDIKDGLSRVIVHSESIYQSRAKIENVYHEMDKCEELFSVRCENYLGKLMARINAIKVQREMEKMESRGDKELSHLSVEHLRAFTMCRIGVMTIVIPIIAITLGAIAHGTNNTLAKSFIETVLDDETKAKICSPSYRSSRYLKILELLEKHREDRVVIVTKFDKSLTYVEEFLKKDIGNRPLFKFQSEMKMETRKKVVERFNETPTCVIMGTYSLMSEGLNMQKGNVVILSELPDNNKKMDQAIARCDRMGQKKDVYAYILCSGTYCEKTILEKQRDKLKNASKLFKGEGLSASITTCTRDKLFSMVSESELREASDGLMRARSDGIRF